MLSIIIPSYNDGKNVINLINQIEKQGQFEIIVVESGNTNYFKNNKKNIKFLESAKGRSKQLKFAAENATGNTLVFFHADSDISQINLKSLDNYSGWACFKIKFDSNKLYYRFIEFTSNIRSKYLNIPFGDQGIVIDKNLYKKSGGYTEEMIYEDIDLAKNLNKIEKNKVLDQTIITQARRFEEHGTIYTHFIMSLIFYSYLLGFIKVAKSLYRRIA